MSAALRIGLVGAGPWGRNYLKALARRDDAAVVAVASGNPETPAFAGNACRVHANWQALADETLDGVIIATPPASHLGIARRFGELGTALLIEKPLCLDLGEALAFRELATKFRAPVLVDHIHLYSPAYRLLKQLSPLLGRVTGIHSAGGRNGPVRSDSPALWDWGPHDVSMALDLMATEPVAIAGRRTLHRSSGPGQEENFEIELEFRDAVRAHIAIGNAMDPMRRFEVAHERGDLVYDDLADRKLTYHPASGGSEPHVAEAVAAAGPFRPPLDCVVEDFCAAIRAGRPDGRQLNLAIGVIRVLDQVGRAAH